MIKHIVLFNFKQSAGGADRAQNMQTAKAMLLALAGSVPTLLSMSAGPNAVPGASAWDFALVAEFENEEGLRQYQEHPEHVKVSKFISSVRSDRASVDFYDEITTYAKK